MTRWRLGVSVLLFGAVAAPAPAATPYDLDRDRRQEAVLGVSGWSAGGAPNAGAVIVLRAASDGLSRRPQLLMEGVNSLPGVAQGDDAFGAWTASGDFNGDGVADLAVAAPGDRTTLVVAGSPAGLRKRGVRMIPAAGPLVAGDLDADGDAELIVGMPSADPLRKHGDASGAIRLYLGGKRGLGTKPFRTLERPRRRDARFGASLAVGDVNGDGRLDIVEGSQGFPSNYDGEGYPGHLSFCPGTPSGPRRCRPIGAPLPGGPTTLAVADFDGDGFDDVAAGRPVDDYIIESAPAGAVHVWRGTPTGPDAHAFAISQNSPRVPGRSERGDEFGASVAAADIDRDGYADLVIGAPGEDKGHGSVTAIRGGRRGTVGNGSRRLQQARARRRPGDRFGAAVTLLRLTRGRPPDLIAGAPGDRSLTVFRAVKNGRLRGIQRLVPSRLGLRVPPEPPDVLVGFGGQLARPAGS